MKNLWIIAVSSCALAMLLVACGEDKPSEKIAADAVYKVAEQEAHLGLKVVNFVRENGWVDEQSPNRYKVRYNYNLELVKPYSEVVLENAKNIRKNLTNLEALQLSWSINGWDKNQGDGFMQRYEKFVNSCVACTAYLLDQEISEHERKIRFGSYFSSWEFFEELGFKDDAAIGSKISRQAWSAFMKTENGWLPVQ